MRRFALVILLMASVALVGKSQGIQFHHDISLEQAFAKAKQEGKLIFIDAYATWCGPCKYLSKNIFTQSSVGNYFNKNFINVKVDMEKAPVGPKVDAKYNVTAYPTLLFLNANGDLVHKEVGAGDANYILGIGKKAVSKGGKTTTNVSHSSGIEFHHDISLEEAFSKAKQENKLIFIDAYTTWCGPCKYLSKNIFTQSSVGSFYNKNFINVKVNMEKAPVGPKVDAKYNVRAYPTLLFVDANGNLVLKKEGAGDANYILGIGKTALGKKSGVSNTGGVSAEDYTAAFKSVSNNKSNRSLWNNFVKKAEAYFSSSSVQAIDINNGCWFIYENYKTFNDVSTLRKAKNWSKKSIQMQPNSSYNLDTYAHILFALGYVNDAVKYEEMALQKATQNGDSQDDINFYKGELAKFKSSLR